MHEVEAKGILSAQNGMNIYRGCTHGCIYCDSRSRCYQMNHLFEDIEVKINAAELLERVLRSKRKRCMIGTGAMCDPYIPLEEELGLTRRCLELIRDYGYGLAIQTKSAGILRDLELLAEINHRAKCVVQMTMTTADEKLCRILEPKVSTTQERYQVLKTMQEQGIPTIVWLSPILPFINDTRENIQGILDLCFDAGVKGIICFGMGVTLREGNREYFYEKLDHHFPGMKELYIRQYGNAYECTSPSHRQLMEYFRERCISRGVEYRADRNFEYLHAFPEENVQLNLFDLI